MYLRRAAWSKLDPLLTERYSAVLNVSEAGCLAMLLPLHCELWRAKAMRIQTTHVRHLAFLSQARKAQGWLQESACAIHVRKTPATASASLGCELLRLSVVCQGF